MQIDTGEFSLPPDACSQSGSCFLITSLLSLNLRTCTRFKLTSRYAHTLLTAAHTRLPLPFTRKLYYKYYNRCNFLLHFDSCSIHVFFFLRIFSMHSLYFLWSFYFKITRTLNVSRLALHKILRISYWSLSLNMAR